MKRLGIALSAGLLFAVASQAAPAGAQLELLDGAEDVADPSGDGDALGGLLDSVAPTEDDPVPVPKPVTDTVDKVTETVLPGDPDEEPDPDPDPPVDPVDDDGSAEDDGATPKPRSNGGNGGNDGGDPAGTPAPPVVEDTQSLAATVGSGSGGGTSYAGGTVVAGETVVADSLDLQPRKAEAQAAASLPVGDGGSPFGPVQFLAVILVAAVMCAEFLYGVRRSTGEVYRA